MSDDPKLKALELANHLGGTHTEVVARATAYHAYLTGGKPAAAAPAATGKPAPVTTAGKSAPAATGKPTPAPAHKPAPAATGKPAPANKPKPTAAAAQTGKYSLDQVREIIKKVVATEGLGKEMAVELLDTEGGVKKISDLKPADYDKVYEACDGALNGGEAGATGDAAVEFDEDDPTA